MSAAAAAAAAAVAAPQVRKGMAVRSLLLRLCLAVFAVTVSGFSTSSPHTRNCHRRCFNFGTRVGEATRSIPCIALAVTADNRQMDAGSDEDDADRDATADAGADEILELMQVGEGIMSKTFADRSRHADTAGGAADADDVNQVQKLVNERSQARALRDFVTVNAIADELRVLHNVEVLDDEGVWVCQQTGDTGGARSGPLNALLYYQLHLTHTENSEAFKSLDPEVPACTLSAEESQALVDLRTAARRAWQYDEADKIRGELAANGVELFDKANLWRSLDGALSGQQSRDLAEHKDRRSRRRDAEETHGEKRAKR